MNSHDDRLGLCRNCGNVRVVKNERGSTFYLCRLAEKNPCFPKYPRLPVLSCDGYVASFPAGASPKKGDE